MRSWLIGAVGLVVGCTSTQPTADEPETAHAVEAPPTDPSFEVMAKICAHPCAGGLASVRVFRDGDGKAARIRFDGDLQTCSHPPRIYFDAEGNETLSIPNEPVVAGSAEAEEFARQQAGQTQGLLEAEPLSCTEPGFCDPARTEGFRSDYPCRADDDCAECQCGPVDRVEFARRGGPEPCTDASAECTATNPVCCGGRCMLAR